MGTLVRGEQARIGFVTDIIILVPVDRRCQIYRRSWVIHPTITKCRSLIYKADVYPRVSGGQEGQAQDPHFLRAT